MNDHSLVEHKNICDWIKNKGVLSMSLISSGSPKLYHAELSERKHIKGFGFVLDMEVNNLAAISYDDARSLWDFSHKPECYFSSPLNYFYSIFTTVILATHLDVSITKTPGQILKNTEEHNEIVYRFTKDDWRLIKGVFCLVDKQQSIATHDDEFISKLKCFAENAKIAFVML